MTPFEVESTIREALDVSHIEISNPREDGLHFEAIVVSPAFEKASLIEQHQLVMNALKTHFRERLHALSLKTFTPSQWNKQHG
jgi:acid stress-induced BolA-like protein IbaG/YrbA